MTENGRARLITIAAIILAIVAGLAFSIVVTYDNDRDIERQYVHSAQR